MRRSTTNYVVMTIADRNMSLTSGGSRITIGHAQHAANRHLARAVSADDAVSRLTSGLRMFVHGAVATPNLLGQSLRQRAEALIGIAHPEVRSSLRAEFAERRHFVLSGA